jgi:hypothetical protein
MAYGEAKHSSGKAQRDRALVYLRKPKASGETNRCLQVQPQDKKPQSLIVQENDPFLANSDEKASLRPKESVSNKAIP